MDKSHLDLLKRYQEDTCNEQEKAIVEAWYADLNKNNRILLSDEELDHAESLMRVKVIEQTSVKKYKLWPRIAAAAAIIFALSAGTYMIQYKYRPVNNETAVIKQDVRPGSNGAILTLANGQKVILAKGGSGIINQQNGSVLVKVGDSNLIYHSNGDPREQLAPYNTLETPRGHQYSVRLPDGTKVWLNAASSLKYPTSFTSLQERKVILTGEAYFEVAKDKSHPFKVITAKQEVRVLGTHFNVNSYDDEPTVNTTLLEGSVQINGNTFLKPGQQANLYHSGKLLVSKGSESVIAWKDGKFRFEDTSMEAVLRQFSRWYDVDIIYPNGVPQEIFSGYLDRNLNASEALDILSYTGVKFKIEGRKIFVFK